MKKKKLMILFYSLFASLEHVQNGYRRCTSDIPCPYNQACETSTNKCIIPIYVLYAHCEFGNNLTEGTTSRVSLVVKSSDSTISDYSVYAMTTQSLGYGEAGQCPIQAFEFVQPDSFEIQIHGSDKLGVAYFWLRDENDKEVRWDGDDDGNNWCFSTNGKDNCWGGINGANYPNKGVILNMDGTSERIKFPGGTPCKDAVVCSSGSCVLGGGSCGLLKKCCEPVSC